MFTPVTRVAFAVMGSSRVDGLRARGDAQLLIATLLIVPFGLRTRVAVGAEG